MSKKQRLFQVIYANTVISLFNSSTNACLNIVSQIFEQKGFSNLGNLSVFLLFAMGLIANFLCVTYIKKYSFRWMFFLHAYGYLFFVANGVLVCYCNDTSIVPNTPICSKSVTWILVTISSTITGFMVAGFIILLHFQRFWISQNNYISECSQPEDVGLFYGIGWALIQCSLIIGSLYSAYVIEDLGQFNFFCLMFIMGLIISFLFLFVPQPPQKQNQHSIIQEVVSLNKSEQYVQMDTNWKAEDFYKLKVKQQLNQLWNVMEKPKVMLINFPIMVTGVMLSFQYTVMHLLIENSIDLNQPEETVNSLTFKVVLCLGCTEVLGGVIIYQYFHKIYQVIQVTLGYINNYYTKTKVLIFLNLLFQSALIIAFINVFLKNYTLCFLVSGIWGFIDCGTTSTLLSLLSEHFGDDVRIFCDFNFFQCLGGMLGTIISISMRNVQLEWVIITVVFSQITANCLIQAWSRFYQYGENFKTNKKYL